MYTNKRDKLHAFKIEESKKSEKHVTTFYQAHFICHFIKQKEKNNNNVIYFLSAFFKMVLRLFGYCKAHTYNTHHTYYTRYDTPYTYI